MSEQYQFIKIDMEVDVGTRVHVPPRLCIIHSDSSSEELSFNLTRPRDIASWNTLLAAANIKQFKPLLDIAATTCDGNVPELYYHSQCRNLFTLK